MTMGKVKIIDETESSCGCNKSDYHPRKWLASTPPKKSYVDPYLQDTDRSLRNLSSGKRWCCETKQFWEVYG